MDYMNKLELRKAMIGKRKLIDEAKKKLKDKNIFNTVIDSKEYNNAENIFIYVSYNDEVDTHEIIKYSLKVGKKIFVPKVISKKLGMEIIEIKDFSELKKSNYGILEPETSNYAEPSVVELALIPGLAFDRNGGRLGYGGGFYDRYLKLLNTHTHKVGLCYDEQLVDRVPMEEFDVFIDSVITN